MAKECKINDKLTSKPSHDNVISNILSNITPLSAPTACPASSPGMKGTGCTIFGEEKKAPEADIQELDIIPIIPMRYVQKWDVLQRQISETYIPKIPNSLESSEDYELARLRQGYIYIFFSLNGKEYWHVYEHITNEDDDNASIRAEKRNFLAEVPFSFVKYEWENGAKSNWASYDINNPENKPVTYPYVFLNKDVTECWVAYSEYRWPEEFFRKSSEDSNFREKLMTYSDLRCKNSAHNAPLYDIEAHSPYFSGKKESDQEIAEEQVKNELRYTKIVSEEKINLTRNSIIEEHGIIIGLFDLIGDQLDLNVLINYVNDDLEIYKHTYRHPLEIGAMIKSFIKDGKAEGNSWRVDVLDERFDVEYSKLKETAERKTDNIKRLINDWLQYKSRTAKCNLNDYISILCGIAEKLNHKDSYSLSAQESIKILLHESARPFYIIQSISLGKRMMSECYRIMESDIKDDELIYNKSDLNIVSDHLFRTLKILESLSASAYTGGHISNYTFSFHFHIWLDQHAEFIGKKSGKYRENYRTTRLIRNFFDLEGSVKIGTTEEARSFFAETFEKNGSYKTQEDLLTTERAQREMREGAVVGDDLDINKKKTPKHFKKTTVLAYRIKANFSAGKLPIEKQKKYPTLEFAEAGFGATAGLIAATTILFNWTSMDQYASSQKEAVLRFGLSPEAQLLGAVVDVYAASFATGAVNEAMTVYFATPKFINIFSTLRDKMLDKLLNFGTPVGPFKQLPQFAIRSVAINLRALATFSSALLTGLLAFIAAWDAHRNNEKSAKIGNIIWGTSTLCLIGLNSIKISATSAAAAAGTTISFGLGLLITITSWILIIFIIIGLALTLFTRNRFEKAIDYSFWGKNNFTSAGIERVDLELELKNLPKNNESEKSIYFYTSDLNYFFQAKNGMEIVNSKEGDNEVQIIESFGMKESDLEKLKITAKIYYEETVNPLGLPDILVEKQQRIKRLKRILKDITPANNIGELGLVNVSIDKDNFIILHEAGTYYLENPFIHIEAEYSTNLSTFTAEILLELDKV
jgi:hypothetical protein